MHLKKLQKIVFILLVFCVLMVPVAYGQPDDPSADPDTVPITGLEILLGAGALLGVRRLLGKNKEQNT